MIQNHAGLLHAAVGPEKALWRGFGSPTGLGTGSGEPPASALSPPEVFKLRRDCSQPRAAMREAARLGAAVTAPGKPPVPAGDPNRRGTGWGGEVARLPQGKQSWGHVWTAGSEAVQEARAERRWWRCPYPTSRWCQLQQFWSSLTPGTLKGLRSGGPTGTEQGAVRGQVGAWVLPWGVLGAEDQPSCITRDGRHERVWGCPGVGQSTDLGPSGSTGPSSQLPLDTHRIQGPAI